MKLFLTMATVGTALAAITTSAHASTRPGFDAGLELFDYSYRERLDGDVVARDDGRFIGLTAGYVETIGGGWFLRGRLSTDFGKVDYRSEDGRLKNVSQDIGQLELHAGRDIPVGRGTVTPFLGLGSRVLTDHSGGKITESGSLGYDREVSFGYVPIGIAAGFPLGGAKQIIVSGQYNWITTGRTKSRFSKIDPDFPDVRVNMDGGRGLEASALLVLPLGRHAFNVGPFIRHWNIKRSKTLTVTEGTETAEFFEPKNRTTEAGFKLTFGF